MSKKIIGFSGSPLKNSNTDRLLKHVLESSGLEYEIIKLSDVNVRPCKACRGCVNTNVCVVKDDFPAIAEKIKEADGIVLASYTPYCLIDGYTKALLERFWSFRHQKGLLEGKKLVTIVASLDDTVRQSGHHSLAFEAVLEGMKHVDSLDIDGSNPCNTCAHRDTCKNSDKNTDIPIPSTEYIAVENHTVWSKGKAVGERLGRVINGKEEFVPSELAQNLMNSLEK